MSAPDRPTVCGECAEHRNAPHPFTSRKKPYCAHFGIDAAADKKACRTPWAAKVDDGQTQAEWGAQ